jgi:phage shock protein E
MEVFMFDFQFRGSIISQDQAYTQIKNDPNLLVIDVRTKEEYDEGHIIGSINVDIYAEFIQDIRHACLNQDQRIFIVCASGARASFAVSIMQKLGYTQVYSIGGMGSWVYETSTQSLEDDLS